MRHVRRGERTRSTRSGRTVGHWLSGSLVSWALVAAAGCGTPDPDEAGTGELTGIVIDSGKESGWPLSRDSVSDMANQLVVVMSPEEYRRLYARQNPDSDVPEGDASMGASSWGLPTADLAPAAPPGEPGEATEVELAKGRFRVPWDGSPLVLCFGQGGGDVATISGCQSVPGQPPQAVVVEVGMAVSVEPA